MTDYKADSIQALNDWWSSPLGQQVLQQERALIQSLTPHFHGYYQLQIGAEQSILPQLSKPTIQKIMAPSGDVNGDSKALPFKCHSLDTLLLTHVLEFSSDPHQVLREAERVLVSDGTLILFRFNPWSLWGLKRLFSWQDSLPWLGIFFGHTRIKDWLALLNFDVIATERLLFSPPINNQKWFQRFNFMERWGRRLWPVLSGVTVFVATKRTIPLTPITQPWRRRQIFLGPFAQHPVSREKSNE
jgi:SAM-dependent methyltransferase